MPENVFVRLRPTGPWRIGPDSGDRDRVERIYHSDTLYSAVSHAMARLGRLEEWLAATATAAEPAVRFSSCFPFHGDTVYVTPPRSLWPPPASSKVRWKGAKFAPVTVVESLVSGKGVNEEGWAVDGGSETLIAMGTQGPFQVSVRSSAAVDRAGAGVAPHSSACLEFAPNAGLWAMAAFASEAAREAWKEPVAGALRLLADSGFGGERSRGWGRAEIEFSEPPPALAARETDEAGERAWWLLSLFQPGAADSIDWKRGNYAVAARGGRVESEAGWGLAKRGSRMIAEGSVLICTGPPRGAATDVAPPGFAHPVYRWGHAVAVPIPVKVEPSRVGPATEAAA
ncbi:MAG TPA: hypothetical protein VKV74_04135 [Bryobacteraceae bacterium]|nr:hypothetical protein [Bryobacteraceae bacterium]